MNYEIVNDIEQYIDDIIKLDDEFYDPEYIWDNDYQLAVYKQNKDSFIAVRYNNTLVGYLNYLTIKKDVYDYMKESDTTVDDFRLDDIIKFSNNNYITINSIVIKSEYQNSDIIKIIIDGFLAKLKELSDNCFNISGIVGVAISDDGRKFFRNLGFTNHKELVDGHCMFYLENDVVDTIDKAITKLKNK
jgi:hypothetical protein